MQFIVKATTACNFQCVYCSEGDRKEEFLAEDVFCKLVDEIPSLLERKGERSVGILWHGGEPLLWGHDRLARAMEYAEKKLADYALHFTMQTNGYLLDEAFLELFKRHSVQVGVSLDGYEEMHDRNRPTRDGKPTFSVVWESIQRIRKAGLGGSVLMVLNTAEPVDIDRLFTFIEDNALACKINPLLPSGRAADCDDARRIYQNYVSLLKRLYEKIMDASAEIVIEPLHKMMNGILMGTCMRECSYNGICAAGIMCLYADGIVGLCGRDGEKMHFAYGNLQKQSLLDLYDSPAAKSVRARDVYLQNHGCKECAVWELCHGGCTFEAWLENGTTEAAFPFCQERKDLLEYLQTTGIQLLKKRLVQEKMACRLCLAEKKKILKEALEYAGK